MVNDMITKYEHTRVDEIIQHVLAGGTLCSNSLDGLGEEALNSFMEFHETVFK